MSTEGASPTSVLAVQGPNLLLLRQATGPCSGAVVFLHAISGTLFPYRHLLRHLRPSLQIYGLCAAADSAQAPLSSVRGLARRYAAQTSPIGESWDVQLVGWSFGGCIAYELGQLMSMSSPNRLRVTVVDTAAFRGPSFATSAPAAFDSASLDAAESELTARQARVEAAHSSALASYAPTQGSELDLLVVEASDHEGPLHETPATQPQRVRIAADHFSIIEEPAAGRLAGVINAWHTPAA